MIERLFCANQELNDEAIAKAIEKQYKFDIPGDSMGRLTEIVVKLASHQESAVPQISKPWASIFAADHGVAVEGVSDSPQEKTRQWVENICKGESLVNALVKTDSVQLETIDVGMVSELSHENLSINRVASGTQNFTKQPAMTQQQMFEAIMVGVEAAERAKEAGSDLFIGGELGVANTTSAIAMVSVLSGKDALELVSIGRERVMRSQKAQAELIQSAIDLHKEQLTSPLRVLQYLGGFETAALCGAYIRSAQLGMSVVVDGFMATVAAWVADLVSRNDQLLHCKSEEMFMDLGQYSVPETMFCICGTCPRLVEWCFFSHLSAVNVHKLVLEILAVDPLIQFDMRVGQASGAVLVIPMLNQACEAHKHLSQYVEEIEPLEEEQDCPTCHFTD